MINKWPVKMFLSLCLRLCCFMISTWPLLRCDVGLEEGEYWKNLYVWQYCVLLQWCTKVRAVLTGQSTVLGLDLAWFSSLSSKCLFSLHGAMYIYIIFCLYPLYILVSWAWWDWPLTWLTNHRPSVLWHCWLGYVTCKTVSNMTYNVSSGTLNSTVPYYTCPPVNHHCSDVECGKEAG